MRVGLSRGFRTTGLKWMGWKRAALSRAGLAVLRGGRGLDGALTEEESGDSLVVGVATVGLV